MLPCRRGALLAKSACFKKTSDDIPIKHANDIQIYPKTIKKPIQNVSQKWFEKIVGKNHRNYHQPCDFVVSFWSRLRCSFPPWSVFLATSFSEPLRGYPWSDFGLQCDTLGAMFLTFWMNSGVILPYMSTISKRLSILRIQRATQNCSKITAMITYNILIINILFINPRKSQAPVFV